MNFLTLETGKLQLTELERLETVIIGVSKRAAKGKKKVLPGRNKAPIH